MGCWGMEPRASGLGSILPSELYLQPLEMHLNQWIYRRYQVNFLPLQDRERPILEQTLEFVRLLSLMSSCDPVNAVFAPLGNSKLD